MTGFRPVPSVLALAFWAIPLGVCAKTASNTMVARIKVDTACRLTAEPLAFGNVNIFSGQVDATSSIRLRCGPSVAYSVAIDNGQNFNGQRRMSNGRSGFFAYVPYQLFRNAARTQPWGSAPGALVTGTTPANGLAALTVYGRVPASIVLPRDYADVVTVTVNF